MNKWIILSFVLLFSSVWAEPDIRPSEWAQPIMGLSLSNLYKVDDGLYRSEQPHRSEFQKISELGIKEILNLRQYHSDDDEAVDTDLVLHHINIDTASIAEAQVGAALKVICNRKGPLLVHCWHGSDRTGAIIASYRVVIGGWTKEKAIEELLEGGYGYHSKLYPNILELIRNLDVAKIKLELGAE